MNTTVRASGNNSRTSAFNFAPSQPHLLLLSIAGLFGIVVLIVAYYIIVNNYGNKHEKSALFVKQQYEDNVTNVGNNMVNGVNENNMGWDINRPAPNVSQRNNIGSSMPAPITNTPNITSQVNGKLIPSNGPKQVFNIRQNVYTKADAPAVCALFGADVATIEQLQEAHANGADWCNVGWTKDGFAAYPIQQSTWEKLQENSDPDKRNQCGVPGINLVNNNPNMMYGVNCFGVKPNARGDEKIQESIMSDADILKLQTMERLRKNIDGINVMPFNEDTWCYGATH